MPAIEALLQRGDYICGTCFIFAINVLLHISVILLQKKERSTHTNRHRIIWHLSVVEISLSLMLAVYAAVVYMGKHDWGNVISTVVFYGFGTTYFFVSATLVIDRFLELYLNITYPVYLSETHMTVAAIMYWLAGTVAAIVTSFLNTDNTEDLLLFGVKRLYPFLEGFILLLSSVIYSYIAWKYHKNKVIPAHIKRMQNQSALKRMLKQSRALMRVIFIAIMASIGLAPFVYYFSGREANFTSCMLLLYQFVFTKDGILHILILENVRSKVASMCTKRNKVRPEAENENIDPFVLFERFQGSTREERTRKTSKLTPKTCASSESKTNPIPTVACD